MKTFMISALALALLTGTAAADQISVNAAAGGPAPLSDTQLDTVRAAGDQTAVTVFVHVFSSAATAYTNSDGAGFGLLSGFPSSLENFVPTLVTVISPNPSP